MSDPHEEKRLRLKESYKLGEIHVPPDNEIFTRWLRNASVKIIGFRIRHVDNFG